MTRLAVIGDIHAHHERLQKVLDHVAPQDPDGLLLVGDIGSHHLGRGTQKPAMVQIYLDSVAATLEQARSLGKPVLWVPGNHDLPDLKGQGNVDHTVGTIGDLRVAGIGGAGPDIFGFAYEWREDEILQRTIPDCDVLLCHAPPRRTPLDYVPRRKRHVGSEAILQLVTRHSGVMVCGHIHESPGIIQIEDCICINAGGLGEPFGRTRVAWIEGLDAARYEDLDSGEVITYRRPSPRRT